MALFRESASGRAYRWMADGGSAAGAFAMLGREGDGAVDYNDGVQSKQVWGGSRRCATAVQGRVKLVEDDSEEGRRSKRERK